MAVFPGPRTPDLNPLAWPDREDVISRAKPPPEDSVQRWNPNLPPPRQAAVLIHKEWAVFTS